MADKVFDIPEIIGLLILYLNQKDVSSFARTSRKMHRFWTPSLYRTLKVECTRPFKLFSSTPALHALAHNIQHVRNLTVVIDELGYYYNCVLDIEETHSQIMGTHSSRLAWLPPPEIRACLIVALPPMTYLSRLSLNLGISRKRLYTMLTIDNFRTRLGQLCWLVFLNPGLVDLQLYNVPLLDHRDGRRFARIVAGLSVLKKLNLRIIYTDEGDDWVDIWFLLFFSFPASTQRLNVTFSDISSYSVGDEAISEADDYNQDDGEETMADSYIRRQGPLSDLEDLCFYGVDSYCWDSLTDLQMMFTHCPGIKKLNTYVKSDPEEVKAMGQFIAETCPKIEVLKYGSFECESYDAEAYRILAFLPVQQVTCVKFNDCPIGDH